MQVSLSNHKSTKAFIRNLETQLGQLAKMVEEKLAKIFTTNIEVHLKEHCNVITTRSGNVYKEREKKEEDNDSGEITIERKIENEKKKEKIEKRKE